MSVILLRHTRLAAVAGLCYGQTEVALSATFAEEVGAVRASLPHPVREVRSSPSLRCVALAEVVSNNGISGTEGSYAVRTDRRLMELNFGEWENRPWESFHGPESEAWALDPWTLAPPGGESGAQFWARVAAFRTELLAELAAGSIGADGALVLVVTHAGVIRAWLGLARGLSWGESLALPVGFGTWVEVDRGAESSVSGD